MLYESAIGERTAIIPMIPPTRLGDNLCLVDGWVFRWSLIYDSPKSIIPYLLKVFFFCQVMISVLICYAKDMLPGTFRLLGWFSLCFFRFGFFSSFLLWFVPPRARLNFFYPHRFHSRGIKMNDKKSNK